MKRTDIATIVTIALVSTVAAYLVASMVIGQPNSGSVKVKTVESISSEVQEPDKTVFNAEAVNPTVEVIIGAK